MYYNDLEQTLVTETRRFLAKAGYENSGVNLTRVVDDEACEVIR